MCVERFSLQWHKYPARKNSFRQSPQGRYGPSELHSEAHIAALYWTHIPELASMSQWERHWLEKGFPRVKGAQELKSWSLLLKGLVLSASLCTTEHKAFSLWSSAEEKGGGWKAEAQHFTSESCKALWHKGQVRPEKNLSPLWEDKCMRDEQSIACKSLTCLAEAKARSRAVLKDKRLQEISPWGSKGCRDRAFSTMESS